MTILSLIISGIIGGVIGGMGMGGGTLLIPLLTLLLGVEQHVAQAANLIAFIPMSVIALIIHFKNKLIKIDGITIIIGSAIIFCLIGCLISNSVSGIVLKKIFGAFLIALALFQIYKFIVSERSEKLKNKRL